MAFNLFMHERNIYKQRPDFKKIALDYPEFRVFAVPDDRGRIHIDFNNQDALRALTKILLKKDFNLDITIPDGFLIPTVPQRLNYLLWIEDLLGLLPKRGVPTSGIDIGTGPCAIFSLLGAKKNGWKFVSTETSDEAIQWAEKNIKANNLESHIKVTQVSKDSILEDVLTTNSSSYDFCLCNPPFFENIEEIKRRSSRAKETLATTAKKEEILAEGGEVSFVKNLIKDSLVFKDQVCLYTSMFGRKKSFLQILKELQSVKDISYTKTEFCQGNTIRWGIAWSFLDAVNLQKVEQPKAKKPKKAKPPLLHKISKTDKGDFTVKKLAKWMQNSFLNLKVLFKVVKSAENYAEIQIAADKNTWSHQRRRRRETLKDKEEPSKSSSVVINETQVIGKDLQPGHSVNSAASPVDLDSTIHSSSVSSHSDTFVENSASKQSDSLKSTQVPNRFEIKENTTACILNEKDVGIIGTVSLEKAAICLEPSETACKKRKMEDDDNFLSPPSQKLKIEEEENTIGIKDPTDCLPSQTASRKRKREKEDAAGGSVSQKLKTEDIKILKDSATQIIQGHCYEDHVTEGSTIEEANQSSCDLQKSCKATGIDKDLKVEQNVDEIFEAKSLLFCTLKIRKGEDHLLLEMNCLPEANRESMHQIFQFLKNKLTIS